MKRIWLLAGLPLAVMGTSAMAAQPRTSAVRDNGFSYNYVQGGYENQDWDGGLNVDALDGKLSYALDEHLFVRGGMQVFDGDYGRNNSINGWRLNAGMGFHTPLKSRLDLVLTGDIVHIDYDVGSDNGIALTGGVRHATTDKLELEGGAFMEDVQKSQFGLYGDARVHLNKQVDVGANLKLGDDVTAIGVYGRYNF